MFQRGGASWERDCSHLIAALGRKSLERLVSFWKHDAVLAGEYLVASADVTHDGPTSCRLQLRQEGILCQISHDPSTLMGLLISSISLLRIYNTKSSVAHCCPADRAGSCIPKLPGWPPRVSPPRRRACASLRVHQDRTHARRGRADREPAACISI